MIREFSNEELYGVSDKDYLKMLNKSATKVLEAVTTQLNIDINLLKERYLEVREYYHRGGQLSFPPIISDLPPSLSTIENLLTTIVETRKRKEKKLKHYQTLGR